MLVRAEQACFIDGSRRKAGAVFEYKGKPTGWLVPVKDVEPDPQPEPVTDDVMRVKLAENGVKVNPKATRQQMDVMAKR
jgi:hypothetical protein